MLTRETLETCIRRNKMLPNFRARFCTRELKILPYANYLAALTESGADVVSCVGIRRDEPKRESGDYFGIPGITQRFPLREWGWHLRDVVQYLNDCDINIPARTDCAICFYQRLGEWWDLWHDHPERFAKAAALEEEFGHTFRSPARDTWPAALKDLGAEFDKGLIPKGATANYEMFDASSTRCRVCRM